MSTLELSSIDTEILARVVNPDQGDLPADLAQVVLKLEFQPSDQSRMQELAEKAQDGELSEAEQSELDGFVRVGHFVSLLKSKARVSLRRHSGALPDGSDSDRPIAP